MFCVNIAHVVELTKTFRSFGIDARYIFAATPAAERQEIVSSFKKGDFPVLINCGECSLRLIIYGASIKLVYHHSAILTEGADIPNVDCVILAKPTRSRNVFAQMVRAISN